MLLLAQCGEALVDVGLRLLERVEPGEALAQLGGLAAGLLGLGAQRLDAGAVGLGLGGQLGEPAAVVAREALGLVAVDGQRGDLLAQGVGLALDALDALERGGQLAAGGLACSSRSRSSRSTVAASSAWTAAAVAACCSRTRPISAVSSAAHASEPSLWLRSVSARRASICCVASSARRVASATASSARSWAARTASASWASAAAAASLASARPRSTSSRRAASSARAASAAASALPRSWPDCWSSSAARSRRSMRASVSRSARGVGREGVEALLELGAQHLRVALGGGGAVLGVAAGLVELGGEAVRHPLEVVDALEGREQAGDDRGGVVEVVDVLALDARVRVVRRSSVSASAAALGGLARGELGLDPRGRRERAEDDERAGGAPALPRCGLLLDRLAQRAHHDRVLLAHAHQHQVHGQLEAQVLEEQREVEALVELDGDEHRLHREAVAVGVRGGDARRGRDLRRLALLEERAPGLRLRRAARRSACRRTTARARPGPGGRTAARPARTTWRPTLPSVSTKYPPTICRRTSSSGSCTAAASAVALSTSDASDGGAPGTPGTECAEGFIGFSKGVGHSFPLYRQISGGRQPLVEKHGRGSGVQRGRSARLARERGREALVVELDRDRHDGLQALGERARRARLVGVAAAQRDRQPDDHPLRPGLGDHRLDPLQPLAGVGPQHGLERRRQRSAGIRHRDPAAGRSMVEGEHAHPHNLKGPGPFTLQPKGSDPFTLRRMPTCAPSSRRTCSRRSPRNGSDAQRERARRTLAVDAVHRAARGGGARRGGRRPGRRAAAHRSPTPPTAPSAAPA